MRRTAATAFSAADEECESPSDIPCRRTRLGPKPLLDATRTASTAASSKTTTFPAQDAFHRRVLARPRFHGASSASPPPGPRILPSRPGFRRFFASRKRKARHRRFRGLIARERSAPRAARRLLQSKRFASTTDGSTKLQAFGRFSSLRPRGPPSPDPLPPCGGAGPRSHGSGAGVFGDAMPAPFDTIARFRRLGPNPIGSDTSCRALAAFVAGVATTPFEPALVSCFRPTRPRPGFRRPGGRAASHTLPRRRLRSAAPEVPSISEPPRWRRGLCPHAVPSLWTTGLAPFQSSHVPTP